MPIPAAIEPGDAGSEVNSELGATEPSEFLAVKALMGPLGESLAPGESVPPANRLFAPWLNAAQLTPA